MRWLRFSLVAMLLASGPSGAQEGYCHWIRLNGLYVGETSDFLAWGDYLPLIALEPGELFSLLPGSEESVELAAKKEHQIDGHWYYLPAHLIDGAGMTLKVMILDRDQDTDDDLVLPMRAHLVPLDRGFSPSGHKQIEIFEVYVLDDQPTKSNEIRFRFELRRKPGSCGPEGPEAVAADSSRRKENRIHQLRSRIFRYFDEPVIAGREVKLFVDDESANAAAAYAIARRNLHELLSLGREVDRLEGAGGVDELRHEFANLIAKLVQKRLVFTRVEQDGEKSRRVTVTAPALASDSEWKGLVPDAVVEPIPERWLSP